MVKVYTEEITSDFKGTIIDLETYGYFFNQYRDSRRCINIIPFIFGTINNRRIKILCAVDNDSVPELKKEILILLPKLKRPYYAFNTNFERSVLFYFLNQKIEFEGELNSAMYERKKDVVIDLQILNYDDPFYDNSMACMNAWLKGNFDDAIKHNRSCLLKERDILLKRGFRKPDKLIYVPLKQHDH